VVGEGESLHIELAEIVRPQVRGGRERLERHDLPCDLTVECGGDCCDGGLRLPFEMRLLRDGEPKGDRARK
jgi:hypothetical protein